MSLKNTALYEAVVSNQQLFLRRGNPLCTWWLYFKQHDAVLRHGDGRDIECMAGPETIQSRPPDWSSGLEIPFVFLRQQDPHTNLETNPGYSMLGSSLQCDWRSPHPSSRPVRPFLHQLQGQKQTMPPLNTSTLHSIQTEGPGIAVLPKI